MKNILVPTDFSPTAKNAAVYAIHLAEQLKAASVIFYHAYQEPIVTDITLPAIDLIPVKDLQSISELGLQRFYDDVKNIVTTDINITTLSDYNYIAAGLDDVCKDNNVDLIVMGITGGGKLEEALIGSNTVDVAKNGTVPVIIVPAEAKFTPIKEIMLACDFDKVVETTPVTPIRKILDETGAKLFIFHVDKTGKQDNAKSFESLMLDTLLEGYDREYHFSNNKDFTEAINQFAVEKEIDLIITIPKKHGLFEGLFRKKHTKMLAFHSHVPLMVIHE
jgi:nucleotide-binding universal stress UspA family protein